MMKTVGSLYSGVGGIDLGFKQAGFEILWANEIDKNACKTFSLNHDTKLYALPIEELDVTNLESVDVLSAGFPCQDFSIIGKKNGFEGKTGRQFFNIMEFLDVLKPNVLFLENVKNIKTHAGGETYKTIISEITKRGYCFKDAILNTLDHSILPQNRERWYLVAFKNKERFEKFSFPDKTKTVVAVSQMLEDKVAEKYYYGEERPFYNKLVEGVVKKGVVYQWRKYYLRENKKGVCPTLTAYMGTGGNNVPIILDDVGIRKLTPKECFELQGLDMALPALADCHLYKQAGNSVSVPVIKRIAEKILEVLV